MIIILIISVNQLYKEKITLLAQLVACKSRMWQFSRSFWNCANEYIIHVTMMELTTPSFFDGHDMLRYVHQAMSVYFFPRILLDTVALIAVAIASALAPCFLICAFMNSLTASSSSVGSASGATSNLPLAALLINWLEISPHYLGAGHSMGQTSFPHTPLNTRAHQRNPQARVVLHPIFTCIALVSTTPRMYISTVHTKTASRKCK